MLSNVHIEMFSWLLLQNYFHPIRKLYYRHEHLIRQFIYLEPCTIVLKCFTSCFRLERVNYNIHGNQIEDTAIKSLIEYMLLSRFCYFYGGRRLLGFQLWWQVFEWNFPIFSGPWKAPDVTSLMTERCK